MYLPCIFTKFFGRKNGNESSALYTEVEKLKNSIDIINKMNQDIINNYNEAIVNKMNGSAISKQNEVFISQLNESIIGKMEELTSIVINKLEVEHDILIPLVEAMNKLFKRNRIVTYDCKEVADILHVSARTVNQYINDGKLAAKGCGNVYIILEKDVKAFIENMPSAIDKKNKSKGKSKSKDEDEDKNKNKNK